MRNSLIILFIFICPALYAQNMLVLKDGKRIPYANIDFQKDTISIKTMETDENLSFYFESVIGYCSPIDEENYYIKKNLDWDGDLSYQFFERMEVGTIYLYRRKDTSPDTYLYMEKNGRLENVFNALESGKNKDAIFEVFKSFVADDEESMRYINDKKFNYSLADMVVVIQYYNRRHNYIYNQIDEESRGKVFLYRTKFQKIKNELVIELYGEKHKLYRNDFIEFDIPIQTASKVTVTSDYSSNFKLLAGEMTDQYYEVRFDQKTRKFIFESKEGPERQYEFYKIKKKLGK